MRLWKGSGRRVFGDFESKSHFHLELHTVIVYACIQTPSDRDISIFVCCYNSYYGGLIQLLTPHFDTKLNLFRYIHIYGKRIRNVWIS